MNPRHLATACILISAGPGSAADATVSATGDGDFKTVQEAINQTPQTTSADHPWIILVKPGTYKERLYVQREKRFVHLVGEDAATTTITYNMYAGMKGPDGLDIGTFRTPTVTIDADDFSVEKLTLENSAGPVGQALALTVNGDRVSFRNCVFRGFQDTIFLNRGRQHFENCEIIGAVDFIFGGATAWFEKCTITCVRDGYITAASTPAEEPYGFVFSDCTIATTKPGMKIYLGRPWRPFASTIFLNTHMPEAIRPEGWHNWGKPEREQTSRYAEFNSRGPGANPHKRVAWARNLEAAEAAALKPTVVLDGWKP
jgi:pectinesterase